MSHDNEYEYTIKIDYDGFLTRFDINEIIASIDKAIEEEFLPNYINIESYNLKNPVFSYVGITAVDRGSITLTVMSSSAVFLYVAHHFKNGVDESRLAKELERSGKIAGDLLGSALAKINGWAEGYVKKQRVNGGNVKGISVKRKNKNIPKP